MSFTFKSGSLPILISIPHHGSRIPAEIATTMTADGRSSRDTDWYLEQLYDFPETREASFIIAELSRYVIDLNRPSDNESLYPGQTTTGLVPETCFDGAAVYCAGKFPPAAEVGRRIREIWRPYHEQIRAELDRMVAERGLAVLIDAHSIASRVPRLFYGVLPDFNLGTNYGVTCAPSLQQAVVAVLEHQSEYSFVVNGRFVGGHITRHFGDPQHRIHALQVELSQATYMDEATLKWDDEKASKVQPVFRRIVQAIRDWIPQQ
jgi:N-formylglutamate deformylase